MIANKNNFHHRNLGGDSTEMRLIYYTTHARATPWLIGLLFGYFLHHQNVRKTRLPKWLALVLWILSLSMLATVIFAVYPYTQSGAGDISAMAGAFYLCCSRIAWPLALCWIIWACQNGLAPIVNEFLSWSFWQPLSKLSYCLYIWHLLVETVHIARIKTSLHFSDYDAVSTPYILAKTYKVFTYMLNIFLDSPLLVGLWHYLVCIHVHAPLCWGAIGAPRDGTAKKVSKERGQSRKSKSRPLHWTNWSNSSD